MISKTRSSKYHTIACLALSVFLASAINGFTQEKTGDVLLDAMQDELWENKKNLKIEGFDAPFYLMYGIQDQKVYSVSGILGALVHYSESPNRFRTNTRILVGSYDFNDESLDDNHYSSPTVHEINLPVDDDYYGIRRSFWSSTDEVYRSAARHFRKHQQTVKESGKEWSEIPHRTFARSEPVKLMLDFKPYQWDRTRYETLVRDLSKKFAGASSVENSAVVIQFVEGQHYMVTTEGTIVRIPESSANLTVFAQGRTEEGEFFGEELRFSGTTPAGFPSDKELHAIVDELVAKLQKPVTSNRVDEEYNGPVLVMGGVVAETFTSLLNGRESLNASDNIAKIKGYQYDQSASFDNKIGKPVVHESLTIKATPKVSTYNGMDLLGSFLIDDEAMVPANETVLIENGVLKTLMDNRSVSSASKNAYALGFNEGPGVLEVVCSQKSTDRELKENLIKAAKAEGHEYAFIVRDKQINGAAGNDVYKVSVKDGKEELVTNMQFQRPSLKQLRKVSAASSTTTAHNLRTGGRNGGITSFIVPSAILLGEGDLKPFNPPTLKEERFVSRPAHP